MSKEKLTADDFEKMASKLTKMIIDYTPVAYVVIDKDFKIVYTNNYVKDLTGYHRDELLGLSCYEVVSDGSPCPICAVRKTLETGVMHRILKEESHKNGHTIYNELIAIPLFNEDQTFDYILEIVISKTEEITLAKKIETDFYKLVDTLTYVLGTRDEYTGRHSDNVRDLSMLLADKLNLSDEQKKTLFIAASLHDIGKVGISDSVLNKVGKLTEEEFIIIKSHPVLGEKILRNIESFKHIKEIVKHHHERYDGNGYPDRLEAEEIPFLARIVSIADTYDAMTTTRTYRQSLSVEYARSEIVKYSGTQFDPLIAKVFIELIDEGILR